MAVNREVIMINYVGRGKFNPTRKNTFIFWNNFFLYQIFISYFRRGCFPCVASPLVVIKENYRGSSYLGFPVSFIPEAALIIYRSKLSVNSFSAFFHFWWSNENLINLTHSSVIHNMNGVFVPFFLIGLFT